MTVRYKYTGDTPDSLTLPNEGEIVFTPGEVVEIPTKYQSLAIIKRMVALKKLEEIQEEPQPEPTTEEPAANA
jgi:hypothetical protein